MKAALPGMLLAVNAFAGPPTKVELGGGVWLTESAAQRTTPLAMPTAALSWEWPWLRVDVRYRIAFDAEGSRQFGYDGVFQALEPRVHAVLRRGIFAGTLGVGPAVTLETGAFHFGETFERTRPLLGYGVSAAVGLEVLVGRVPLRLEVGVATRGAQVDGLGAVVVRTP